LRVGGFEVWIWFWGLEGNLRGFCENERGFYRVWVAR